MRAREFIKELDAYPIAGQEYDPYSQRTDIAGIGASKKLGSGTASVQGMATTSPDIDATRIDKNVSANYALPIGSGGISGGVTRTAGFPNNQFNVQANVPVGSGNFSAGVSRTKDQPNNFNLGYSRQLGPGQLDIGIYKQGQGGPTQGQLRYNMPFNEEEASVAKFKKSREDFEGMTIEMVENGHVLVVNALDDWGNNVLGSVAFNIHDNNVLDPQDLKVDERYQGQGIARAMYDYAKSKGYKIHRSYDQTDAGKGFWDKHRGEDVRVWESFDQPYPIQWEQSDYGDYDALATLPDGTYLNIMFEHVTPYEVNISFWRNNSLDVTGEGDAQRIFATVLAAIQKFLTMEQPANISFSASKEIDMDANDSGAKFNPESRAKLYNRMVNRYAAAWGYRAHSFDHGDEVKYELSRIKQDVAEDHHNDTAISLSKLGKFHPGADTLAEFVPERASARYALHPDKWESTFYSLTNKDSDKLKYYGPKKISIPPGTLVGDMAIANKFYRAKTPEEQEQYAELYKASLQPYPVDVSEYRMPELLIPKHGVAEQQLDELSFLGSECTKDCSGHRAGYDWSKRKGLRQANSWSPSFNKGAGLAVAGK